MRALKGTLQRGWMLLAMLGCLLASPSLPAQPSGEAPPAQAAMTNSTQQTPTPVPTPNRRRVGFLAGGGLLVITLLVLAVGLALVHTFKR